MRGKQVKQLRRVARGLATDGIWAGMYAMDRRGAIRHAPGIGKSWLKVLKKHYRSVQRRDTSAMQTLRRIRSGRCSNGTTD